MIVGMITIVLTLLILFFIIEIGRVNKAVVAEVVISTGWRTTFAKRDLEDKKEAFLKGNEKYHYTTEKKASKKVKKWEKQIAAKANEAEKYMGGKKFTVLEEIIVFGYQLLVKLKMDSNSELIRKMTRRCEASGYVQLERNQESNGKRNSSIYAYYLIAAVLGYTYVGVISALFLAVLTIGMGREFTNILVFCLAGFLLPFILGIIPMEELKVKADKRQEAIDREFPNMISKIALLVTAGMNIVKASEEAANSGDSVMYLEMQKTIKDIKQSSSVSNAFMELQCRCNNRYLDKMVALVSKSYTAGNANLADDLREINGECWMDKRHQSKRMGERIQNKLFVPTMLMFVGILVVIIIPAMSGFNF